MVNENGDAEGEGEEDTELETCCICLDSLSSAPVVALLGEQGGGARSCAHLFHARCAERLSPQQCPMCRAPFLALSAPFGGRRWRSQLTAADSERLIAGARRLIGWQASRANPDGDGGWTSTKLSGAATVPPRAVVELLAAIFPVRQAALEAAVDALARAKAAGSPRSSRLLHSDSSCKEEDHEAEIGPEGLVHVLGRCGVQLLAPAAAAATLDSSASGSEPLGRYRLATVIKRRTRWVALKSAGAAGTALFVSGIFASATGLLGALAAIPPGWIVRPSRMAE